MFGSLLLFNKFAPYTSLETIFGKKCIDLSKNSFLASKFLLSVIRKWSYNLIDFSVYLKIRRFILNSKFLYKDINLEKLRLRRKTKVDSSL